MQDAGGSADLDHVSESCSLWIRPYQVETGAGPSPLCDGCPSWPSFRRCVVSPYRRVSFPCPLCPSFNWVSLRCAAGPSSTWVSLRRRCSSASLRRLLWVSFRFPGCFRSTVGCPFAMGVLPLPRCAASYGCPSAFPYMGASPFAGRMIHRWPDGCPCAAGGCPCSATLRQRRQWVSSPGG